eukprot:jgi/Mesen1/2275/ME000154S01445
MTSLVDRPSKIKNVMNLDRESVITTIKPLFVSTLAELIRNEADSQDFLLLCTRIEATIRAWYVRQADELLQLHDLFDPKDSGKRLTRQGLAPAQVDKLESRFLGTLVQTLEKSNFKLLSKQEFDTAKAGHYLLDLPITVDTAKLDRRLLYRYFKEHAHDDLPPYAEQYLIFRRGIGTDRTEDYFMNEKVDALLSRLFKQVLVTLRVKKKEPPPARDVLLLSKKNDITGADDGQEIERIRLQNMPLSFRNLRSKVTLQEPTFERIILVYRRATTSESPSDLGERSIHIRHFHDIPMADLEIVLPEKKTPSLTPLDWLRFTITAVTGFALFMGALEGKQGSMAVAFAILATCLSYFSRVYFAWQASMVRYQNLIQRSMYDKQLDSGKGTLLHLCDDVIQQEVKEAILAYFVLMTQGRADKQELDHKCEVFMQTEFKETIDFDVQDAVNKLVRLNIVNKDANGYFTHQPLKQANDIIGVTTDELVGSLNL